MIKPRTFLTIAAAAGSLVIAAPANADEGDPLPGGDPPPIVATQDEPPLPPYQEGDPLPGGDPVAPVNSFAAVKKATPKKASAKKAKHHKHHKKHRRHRHR